MRSSWMTSEFTDLQKSHAACGLNRKVTQRPLMAESGRSDPHIFRYLNDCFREERTFAF